MDKSELLEAFGETLYCPDFIHPKGEEEAEKRAGELIDEALKDGSIKEFDDIFGDVSTKIVDKLLEEGFIEINEDA